MQKLNKVSITVLAILFTFGYFTFIEAATIVNLGAAEDFVVLGGSGITDTTPSTITGDVGLSPTTGAAIIGLTFGAVTGSIYTVDAFGPIGSFEDASLLTTAKNSLISAYDNAAGQMPVSTTPTELGGTTKNAGIYESAAGDFQITGTLTIDGQGDPDAVFIFRTFSTLVTAVASQVNLINGAQACNVFWQVGSSVTLDTTSTFKGNILALTSITDNGGSTIEGRLLARNGAVTLNNTTMAKPTCTPPVVVIIPPQNPSSVGGPLLQYGHPPAINTPPAIATTEIIVELPPTQKTIEVSPTIVTITLPKLPNTGFPPQEKNRLISFLKLKYLFIMNYENLFTINHVNLEQKIVGSSSPLSLKIPSIDVDAKIKPVGVTSSGLMDTLKQTDQVGWFNQGPRPGEIGSSVIAGHSGYKNNIRTVFDDLYKLKKGDKIYIEDLQGKTTTFIVKKLKNYDRHDNALEVFRSKDGLSHLNLITCAGDWNPIAKTHSDRLVVFTEKLQENLN